MAIELLITTAGLDALVDAQAGQTEAIRVVEIGLTTAVFTMAPTLTQMPGEMKRLDTISGQAVNASIVHMTAVDSSPDVYDLRGIALYLEDGTLFAVYGQSSPIFRKVSIASFLLALDVTFSGGLASEIVFGDATFLLPPATEDYKGVAEIATTAEVSAGIDDSRIVSPLKLRQQLTPLGGSIDDLATKIAALLLRTISGSGLISGGGSLTASRVLDVQKATVADIVAGVADYCAVTPAALSGLNRSLAANGYVVLPGCGGLIMMWGRFLAASNASTSTSFPISFPHQCLSVVTNGGSSGGADSQDNPPVLVDGSINLNGFSVFSADDTASYQRYIALGF